MKHKMLFIGALIMLASTTINAQTLSTQYKYLGDTITRDTFRGVAMMTDSIVRMKPTGRTGEYRYENVLSTIVVDAICVKEYRWLVKASDGKLDPFDMAQRFLFLSGGVIDPKRILFFKQDQK